MSTEPTTRVLFVDDEPLVLQGLQRSLRSMRQEWDMCFVESGSAALTRLSEEPFHVIVSDMRMPAMTGAELLSKVQELYPKTVRLILSGHADNDLIMRCVGSAHQFLAKPCDLETLRNAIARGRRYDSLLLDEKLRRVIGRMESLPSIPAVLNEITEHLRNDDCAIDDIARIIGKDLAMTAKLLKLVNSAFFGLRRQINSPDEAVSYLGISTIKALVLAVNAFAPFDNPRGGAVAMSTVWAHSLEVAGVARKIAASLAGSKQSAETFVAGLLHDVGKLALSANLPTEYGEVLALSRAEGIPLFEAESKAFGADHGAIGGYLLNLWGLPDDVVTAICYHHRPDVAEREHLTGIAAVHLADALVQGDAGSRLLNREWLRRAGFSERLEKWKRLLDDHT